MKTIIAALICVLCLAGATHAQRPHPCAADARTRANALLKLHFEVGPSGRVENFSIGDEVKVLAPVRALRGKGRLDVLEVWGYIYKAEYRMRFIYVQGGSQCALMGQEILEASDPY
jgi:hypothetical protein